RLFAALGRKGLGTPRWAAWMALSDNLTDVSGIALPSAEGRMVLASSGGIYVSDSGRSMWTRTLGGPALMPDKNDLAATSVAVGPTDPRTVFAGTSKGLYVSHNGGFTFSPHTQSEVSDAIFGVVWDAARPDMIAVITGDGVLSSSDGGGHFESSFSGEV